MEDATLLLIWLLGLLILGLVILKLFAKNKKRISKEMVIKIKEQWKWIEEERDWDRMVLEADKLLDFALRQRGLEGNFTEKMRQAAELKILSKVNEIWDAHRLRNRIAHEIDHRERISRGDYKRALKAFKKGIWEVIK